MTITTTSVYTAILEAIQGMDQCDLISLNNEFDADNWISSMESFDDECSGMQPWDIARACFYGGFCPAHDYYRWNAYGNLESTDYVGDWVDMEAIAAHCAENDDDLYCDEIRDILDQYAENEEEV